jgi:uncharacterized protein YgfB (UPF0149 family)
MRNLSYQAVLDALAGAEGRVGAAEAHGMLAGMLCIDGEANPERWLAEVFGEAREDLSEGECGVMLDLGEETRRSLNKVDFSFELFLPDDDAPLHERAQALSEWLQGFLYAIGQEGGAQVWSRECQEVLHDFAEISQLDSQAAGEAEEQAFMEISEFVRVGVQMIRGEARAEPQIPSKRLH